MRGQGRLFALSSVFYHPPRFHARHAGEAPATLRRLQRAAIANANVFEVLVDAVRCCSLGQITNALFEVGGQYRRSM